MRQILLLILVCGAHLLELGIRPGGTFLNQMGDKPINKYVMVEDFGFYICCACPQRGSCSYF